MEEVWKKVVGFEGLYEVSSMGRVRCIGRYVEKLNHGTKVNAYYTPRILEQRYVPEGYLLVSLNSGKNQQSFRVHRLVAQAFIPNPDSKPFINHINGHPDDNRLENLEWCTPSENMIHAIRTGLVKRNGRAKPVAQLDDNGEIISVYASANKAALAIGKSMQCGRNIREVCEKGYGHCGGFAWKRISLDEYDELERKLNGNNQKTFWDD